MVRQNEMERWRYKDGVRESGGKLEIEGKREMEEGQYQVLGS